jgi:hypothetical protein
MLSSPVTGHTLDIKSANCGSTVAVNLIPAKSNCLSIVESRRGCGYDAFPFGIKNCRGRGWLEYRIVAQSTAAETVIVVPEQKLNGKLSGDSWTKIFSDVGAKVIPQESPLSYKWEITLRDKTREVAKLSEKAPSNEGFTTRVERNGNEFRFVIQRVDKRTTPPR